jgi:hypothetical protein
VASALPTEPYILPPFIAAIFCLYLQQYADIVIDCQLLTFCIKIYVWEMYLDTYIFSFFVTTGGSLVWLVKHLTKETLHKGLSNYLKEL